MTVTHKDMGLPSWDIVQSWFGKEFYFGPPVEKKSNFLETKWGTIRDYSKPAPKSFWESFPSRSLPQGPSTRIDVEAFEKEVSRCKESWTWPEKKLAEVALFSLKNGASAKQKSDLPGDIMRNARSAAAAGGAFTDVLGTWLETGYVAGPFFQPPPERL